MQDRQRNGFALAHAEDSGLLAFNLDVWAAEVLQGGHDGDAGGVDEASVVVEDVDVGAEGEAF